MAIFEQAVEKTLQWEGGYSMDPLDPGGETLFGIARNKHPEWSGWSRVDALKAHFSGSGLTGVLNADGGLKESAKQFYEENFWHYDDLDSQPVADKVFDLSVNNGPVKAIIWLQVAVGAKPDGKFGPKTCQATNTLPAIMILGKIKALAKAHYESLPGFAHDGHGWLRRLES